MTFLNVYDLQSFCKKTIGRRNVSTIIEHRLENHHIFTLYPLVNMNFTNSSPTNNEYIILFQRHNQKHLKLMFVAPATPSINFFTENPIKEDYI